MLRARCSPLEQHAAWGMARQLFDPLRARPDWDGLTSGAAGDERFEFGIAVIVAGLASLAEKN